VTVFTEMKQRAGAIASNALANVSAVSSLLQRPASVNRDLRTSNRSAVVCAPHEICEFLGLSPRSRNCAKCAASIC